MYTYVHVQVTNVQLYSRTCKLFYSCEQAQYTQSNNLTNCDFTKYMHAVANISF